MRIFETIEPLKKYLAEAKFQQKKIGLVPTMGALHEGHLALIRRSLKDNEVTVCSIYVNPTQFSNPDDLAKYPRNIDSDIDILNSAGCHVIFCPSNEVMYPDGENKSLNIDFGDIIQVLEGKYRPGHFSGVGVVLSKFFHIIAPHRVYFGQKDLQQIAVVRKLIRELFFDLQLIRVSTVRSDKGLALSSRNSRLSEEEKTTASKLFQTLSVVKQMLLEHPDAISEAKEEAFRFLEREEKVELEYLEVVDADNFGTVSDIRNHEEVAVCIAAYVGGIRLIDNLIL